jgi:hypothetical protein
MPLPFDEEEFISWRENPITRHIFDYLLAGEIEEAKDYYFKIVWEQGNLDPVLRAACVERAKLATELLTLEYADLVASEERINAGI